MDNENGQWISIQTSNSQTEKRPRPVSAYEADSEHDFKSTRTRLKY